MNPTGMDALLRQLRDARLLDDTQQRRLADGWPPDLAASDAAALLVQAGLLTRFQADEALAGRAALLRLGPYLLLEPLGSGAAGDVYKAEHVLMKRLVTLKVFHPQVGPARCDEVAVTAGVSHPNLVAAQHATRLRGRLVLAMEYIDGIDLEHLLAQTGPLPVALAVEVIRQTAQALAYLHGRGMLHGDLKPANVLLAHSGAEARPVVKLIDLGLAREVGLCGTVDYLAPERALGQLGDARSDLYSLGCTFYHLLTGQVPHPGGGATEKMLRHGLDAPEPLLARRPEVPLKIAGIVARLMAVVPEERYPDAETLLAALAAPAGILVASPPPRGKRRWRTAGARVLVAVLIGACAGGAARLTAPSMSMWQPFPRSNGIVVSGRAETFTDLHRAADAAPEGATLTLTGPGPYRIPPLVLKKALTIQAGEGVRPRIERIDAPESAWDALIGSERELTLIGLELAGGAGDQVASLVSGTGKLTLTGCRIKARTAGPLVALRQGTALHLTDVRLDASTQGVAVELGGTQAASVVIDNSQIHVRDAAGAAVLVWSPERSAGASCAIHLTRSHLDAGRVLALRALDGIAEVEANSSRFGFVEALVSLDACRERDWRKHLRWQGRENVWLTRGAFVRHDGKPIAWHEAAQVAGR